MHMVHVPKIYLEDLDSCPPTDHTPQEFGIVVIFVFRVNSHSRLAAGLAGEHQHPKGLAVHQERRRSLLKREYFVPEGDCFPAAEAARAQEQHWQPRMPAQEPVRRWH